MTTQTQANQDGDTYTPAVQLGQGDFTYEWPPRPTAQLATVDIDDDRGGSMLGLAIIITAYFVAGFILGAILF